MSGRIISGEVNSVNDKGFKIDDDFFVYSKYHHVEKPNEGDQVEIVANGKWIHSLAVLRKATVNNRIDKQTKITRSALLNTAVSILRTQNRPVQVEEVIETARELEPFIYELRNTGNGMDDMSL